VKVPYEWLKQFVLTEMEPSELARRLTMRGLEVEAVEEVTPGFSHVKVAKIVEITTHPGASSLSICKVDAGEGLLDVVCGAPNLTVGSRVPLAVVGATVGGHAVEKRKIRGVESTGMLCSEAELGLSDDHSGLFMLPDSLHPGEPLEQMAGLQDTVFDINVAPNRGDLLSVLGIAREVASIAGTEVVLPPILPEDGSGSSLEDLVSLDILNIEACPRYVLKVIQDVSIVPSPFWMRSRITKCGMRPINAVVDITNYIMLELGQPLHAFDYARLRKRRIEVKLTENDMMFRTLDGVDRGLTRGDLLICDGEGPVAIAGIMGGENSEISGNTRDVALESAFFDPYVIRRTARRLGIKSEASLRFEKGIDVVNTRYAAERAAQLLQVLAGGKTVRGKVETYQAKAAKSIFVSFEKIDGIIGIPIEPEIAEKALRSVEINVAEKTAEGLSLSIPHFRHDIVESADIVEEVARIYGYDYIPATMPVVTVQAQRRDREDIYSHRVKEYFRAAGFSEVINFAFFTMKDVENFGISKEDKRTSSVAIMNPISKEYEVMRTLMAPGIMKNIAYNLNRNEKNLRIFETGKVFFENQEGLPSERLSLCFAMTGREREYFWRDNLSEYDFFDIKGTLEGFMTAMDVGFAVQRSEEPFLSRGRAADIMVGDKKAGWIGEVTGETLAAYEIDQRVYCAELIFDIMLAKNEFRKTYRPISRYPQVTRDFSFYVDDEIAIADLMTMMRETSPLIASVGVFDVFKKEERSISFRVIFQSYEDTLTDGEINAIQNTIIAKLTALRGVTLRT
jgi:phenylalanyl-tRNA synthetase beta chain